MFYPFRRLHRALKYLPFLLLFAFLAGCGSHLPETAKVQGKVTWNGAPVAGGTIVFYPEKGRPAMATIQSDGSYRLTTFKDGDGAVLGKHKVTIEASRVTGPPAPKSMEEEMRGVGTIDRSLNAIEWIVPQRYSQPDTSPLRADVAGGANVINFDLPEKAGGAKR